MERLLTARYNNPRLDPKRHVFGQTSRGAPKWFPHELIVFRELAPAYQLLSEYAEAGESEQAEFNRQYMLDLDKLNQERLLAKIRKHGGGDRELVFLCFEDIRKAGKWCHRTALALWLTPIVGVPVVELSEQATPAQGSLL